MNRLGERNGKGKIRPLWDWFMRNEERTTQPEKGNPYMTWYMGLAPGRSHHDYTEIILRG